MIPLSENGARVREQPDLGWARLRNAHDRLMYQNATLVHAQYEARQLLYGQVRGWTCTL